MKRRRNASRFLKLTALYLLAGAITTVAVAWGEAMTVTASTNDLTVPGNQVWCPASDELINRGGDVGSNRLAADRHEVLAHHLQRRRVRAGAHPPG